MSSNESDLRPRRRGRNASSRSPHPYRRKSLSLQNRHYNSSSTDVPNADANVKVNANAKVIFDSSEDYAVEADDEKGPLLRLPAPPIVARKGLKGVKDPSVEWTPAISPTSTPSVEKSGIDFLTDGSYEEPAQIRQEKDEHYAKYIKRRRGEIVRRATETVVLLIMAVLSLQDQKTYPQPEHMLNHHSLRKWKYELECFIAIIFGCYFLYPIRKSLRLRNAGHQLGTAFQQGFHIPSRFDPGILLYPVLLPLLVVASIGDHDLPILVNITLGLASMPKEVIPCGRLGISSLQWILSLIPVSVLTPFKLQPSALKVNAYAAYVDQKELSLLYPFHQNVVQEELSLLYPLHQNVVQVVSSLVTTSLDPSEIQLLSTSLINLLFFASTPQSQILKVLLWAGGLCLFVFCEFALKAEVALARVPAWRFARNRPSKKGLKGRINRILRALLPEARSRFAMSTSSDSEDETSALLIPPKRRRKPRNVADLHDHSDTALSKTPLADGSRANGESYDIGQIPKMARSATFSVYGRAATMAIKWRNIATSSNPYMRLNFLHAQALKIILAIYVYIAVGVTILFPVRYLITHRALLGNEAVGWAVGYFAGDIPQVRMFVLSNNLEWWVKLPVNKARVDSSDKTGWVDSLRRQIVGAANVRIGLAAYCVVVISIGIVVVLQLNSIVEVDTRRKVFHGVMVAMLLPSIPIDPCFFALALMVALAIFLMLDLFRASQLPPISRPLTNFLAPYVDGRDYRGPVIVSHIFLLIGCAIPLWLSLVSIPRDGQGPWEGWEAASRDLSMVSGVICVGMGDAAASLIGRRYGKTKWYWGGGKSIEGSAAFVMAVTTGLTASWLWLRIGGWEPFCFSELPGAIVKAVLAGTGASIMESTLTAANDNVVVPIGLWLLVRGLRI